MKKHQVNVIIRPNAEIIPIGTELLVSGRVDTNSIFLAEQLSKIGICIRQKTVVGDEIQDIVRALSQAVSRSSVVIMTGGLGPTVDDLTRQAVAKATKRSLRKSVTALCHIKEQLTLRGRIMTPMQHRQAMLPAGSKMLHNSVGIAPGFFLNWHNCLIVVLPGVPYEMKTMFVDAVLPILTKQIPHSCLLQPYVLHTFGLPESDVETLIHPLLQSYPDVQVGLRASPLGVSLTLLKWENPRVQSTQTISTYALIENIQRVLGNCVYGYNEESMELVVGRQLANSGLSLALAESCTGGLIGHRLTQIPGSSRYLDRGVICYSNQAKTDWLNVSKSLLRRHGAVSKQVAAAMAKGIRQQAGTHIGLSVTGIAGPDGGTKAKPVGFVCIGLNTSKGSHTQVYQFHGDREDIKLRASQAALNMLRRWLATCHCDVEND